MRGRRKLICLFALSGCGFFGTHKEKGNSADVAELRMLHSGWLSEIEGFADETTWPSRGCDAMLWAGEAYAAGATSINYAEAEYAPGEIHRRPLPECYPLESRSTVSQDMLTGYMWAIWRAHDLGAMQRMAAYGEAHTSVLGWIMGSPYPQEISSVVMRGNLTGALGRMLYTTSGGTDKRSYRAQLTAYSTQGADFERHLTVLGVLLQGETRGVIELTEVSNGERETLQELAEESPEDALFQAANAVYTGDASRALSLLSDPAYVCPSYVRDHPSYCSIHKAFAASIILKSNI